MLQLPGAGNDCKNENLLEPAATDEEFPPDKLCLLGAKQVNLGVLFVIEAARATNYSGGGGGKEEGKETSTH